jgi:hypothetical protein
MWLFLTFLAVVALVAVGLYLRDRNGRKAAAKSPDRDAGTFHAVSIRFDQRSACDAARKLKKQRFLSAEAPRLPLPGCTARQCACSYRRYADRRAGSRRASETGSFEPLFRGRDQRTNPKGRRAEDLGESAARSRPEPNWDPSSSYYDFIEESGRHKKLEEE